MSPAEQRFWMAAQRRAAGLQPEIHRAILRAFQIIRDSLTEAELERLVASGQLETIVNEILSDAVLDRAFLPVRDRIRQTTQSGFRYAVPSLPGAGKIDGVLAVMFDHLSPHVVVAINTLETRVITSLQADIREAVRTIVRANLELGKSSSVAARQIRPIIGMSPTQAENSVKYEAKLREQGTMTEAQIKKAVAAYRKKAIALNAETNAGTATKDAYKQGQQLAWQDAVDKGIVDGGRLRKQWIGVMDNRERPEHVAMEKEVQPYDQLYSNGEMVPGDSTYNCVVPGTVVSGAFVGGLKANYSGPLREIETARGHRLTVTPNHPVFTLSGWIPARVLSEGFALLTYLNGIKATGSAARGGPDNQNGEAAVENVFDTLAASGSCATRRICRLDLHGDAQFADSEIDVVGADVQLAREPRVTPLDGVNDRPLNPSFVDESFTPGLSPLQFHRDGVTLAPPRLLSGFDLSGGSLRIALDALPLEPFRLGPAADWHTTLGEASKQDDALIPGFVGEMLEASSETIALDYVVKVRDFDATTHVYDLQAEDGWMIASGIVISNCRCISRFFVAAA